MATREASDTFACFGSDCSVLVLGDDADSAGSAGDAVESARARLLAWHDRFTRFEATSELSRLNADPSEEVPVSADMARFLQAVVQAARATGGLVDATLLAEVERAGYDGDLRGGLPLELALKMAPARRAAGPSGDAAWRQIAVDATRRTVARPPGMRFDSGGLAKGLIADLLAARLRGHESFAIDCAGDLRLGGAGAIAREIRVASPFAAGDTLHTFVAADAGVATSGIGRRSWLDRDATAAHHLIDPATGRPAFTGVVQVTALAPTALEAEIRSKAALLSGPDAAPGWLPHGGVVVRDDGTHRVVANPRPAAISGNSQSLRAVGPGAVPKIVVTTTRHGKDLYAEVQRGSTGADRGRGDGARRDRHRRRRPPSPHQAPRGQHDDVDHRSPAAGKP